MKLSGRKHRAKATSFKHYLGGKLPKPLTDEKRKTELVTLLRADPTSKAVRDELILGHLALSGQTVGRYLTVLNHRNSMEELMSAMLEGVTDAVNQFPTECTHENITGYIGEKVHSYVSRVLESQPVVRIPGSTQRMRKQRGKDYVPAPKIVDCSLSVVNKGMFTSDTKLQQAETNEMMQKVCVNDQQREVLRLRLEGMGDTEIAEHMSLNRTSVYIIRKEIQKRYKELSR